MEAMDPETDRCAVEAVDRNRAAAWARLAVETAPWDPAATGQLQEPAQAA
jgi:hypothetical protein